METHSVPGQKHSVGSNFMVSTLWHQAVKESEWLTHTPRVPYSTTLTPHWYAFFVCTSVGNCDCYQECADRQVWSYRYLPRKRCNGIILLSRLAAMHSSSAVQVQYSLKRNSTPTWTWQVSHYLISEDHRTNHCMQLWFSMVPSLLLSEAASIPNIK